MSPACLKWGNARAMGDRELIPIDPLTRSRRGLSWEGMSVSVWGKYSQWGVRW